MERRPSARPSQNDAIRLNENVPLTQCRVFSVSRVCGGCREYRTGRSLPAFPIEQRSCGLVSPAGKRRRSPGKVEFGSGGGVLLAAKAEAWGRIDPALPQPRRRRIKSCVPERTASQKPITPPLRGSPRRRAEWRRLMRWGADAGRQTALRARQSRKRAGLFSRKGPGGGESSRQWLGRPAGPGSTVPSRAYPPSARPPPSGRRFGIRRPAPKQSTFRWLPLPAPSRRNT